jgi:hypothetical protein
VTVERTGTAAIGAKATVSIIKIQDHLGARREIVGMISSSEALSGKMTGGKLQDALCFDAKTTVSPFEREPVNVSVVPVFLRHDVRNILLCNGAVV